MHPFIAWLASERSNWLLAVACGLVLLAPIVILCGALS